MDSLDKELFKDSTPLQSWYQTFGEGIIDLSEKGETLVFPYLLENAPRRWYSRMVINLFTPVERDSAKIFFPLSIDYESLLLGCTFGIFLAFRHFLDYHLAKYPVFRPGECLCCGRNNHFYLKWYLTHINPRKFIMHDRKLFRRKLRMGLSHGLTYGILGALGCHGLFSHNLGTVERHFPIFIGSCIISVQLYLFHRNFENTDVHFNFYKHNELYGLAFLVLYTCFRNFRNYTSNIPCQRVLVG